MSFAVPHKHKKAVRFPFKMSNNTPETPNLSQRIGESGFVEELVNPSDTSATSRYPTVPSLFNSRTPVRDSLETESTQLEDETVDACLPYLNGNPYGFGLNSYGIPHLQRQKHVNFLKQALGKYPPKFVLMDASRAWIFYWAIAGLSMLGEDVSVYQER
jgi:protein farnesyltransferase subunit beta